MEELASDYVPIYIYIYIYIYILYIYIYIYIYIYTVNLLNDLCWFEPTKEFIGGQKEENGEREH